MTLCGLQTSLNIVSAVAAIVAAALWYRSAQVDTPASFSVTVKHLHGLPMTTMQGDTTTGEPVGEAESPELQKLGAALRTQSKLSGHAAAWAAGSAVAQAIALLLRSWC